MSDTFLRAALPDRLALWSAALLVVASALTSFLTAAFGLGGGVGDGGGDGEPRPD